MSWLSRLLGDDDEIKKTLMAEQNFDVLDYHRKYPQMDREDAEVLTALNRLIRQAREQEKRNDIPEEWR